MIKSYRDKAVEALYQTGDCPGRWRAFRKSAIRKLAMLDAATELIDLRSPPGNRLERLKGARQGQYSIRINDQWRICFKWKAGVSEVEIVDYH